jgi:2-C-methyl-D-erythritol 2,4-cyclodiphosphate synthase
VTTPPKRPPFRVGHGYDLHRLRDGGTLMLGGVAVSNEVTAVAHSDGDVVLHALVDALLGGVGRGDIGSHFPDTDPRWKGAASRTFVEYALAAAKGAGYGVVNVDVTILAERPRLGLLKHDIRGCVADMLGLDLPLVNIKAGTNEGCDAIGRGEAIAAHAVVLLEAQF